MKNTSRLQQRLEDSIVSARTTLEADCFRAERAGYLARLGHFDEVQTELDALHARYDARPNASISAWLNLVEGLVIHSKEMGPAAADKVLRAYALSGAVGLVSLRALSASWLAHFAFLKIDIAMMVAYAQETLNLSNQFDHSARARVNLVVAQGYHQAGRLDLALPWYSFAHQHAVSDGDDAMLSALMHNMAWLRASNLRQAELFASETAVEGRSVVLGAESTAHFDLLVGSTNLQAHIPILRAKLLLSSGKLVEALSLFEAHIETALKEGMGRLQSDLIADQAWCRIQLGQTDAAKRDATLAESGLDPRGQPDDRAFAHSRLSEVFRMLGDPEATARHQALATSAWQEYVHFQGAMLVELQTLSMVGPK